MHKEFDSLVENSTFEWQKAPKDKNIVGSKWVYTLKYKQDRSYEYKARFVAKGYSQIYGENYRETFDDKYGSHKITIASSNPIWFVNPSYGY